MPDEPSVLPEKYCAFISYSHRDMRWARWLQTKIERFRVPPLLQEQAGRRRRIGRVFRDRDELSAGVLNDKLREALLESAFLVVICSPAAADSRYVAEEIEFFKAHHPVDRIIPFIVGGTPHADAQAAPGARECLPEPLRGASHAEAEASAAATLELLGPDARKQADGPRRALVKLIAALLGVDFDLLWQREKRRRTRHVCGWTFVCALLACAIIALQVENTRRRQEEAGRHEAAQRAAEARRLSEQAAATAHLAATVAADEEKRLAQLAEKDFRRGCAAAVEGKPDEALAWLARAVRSARHPGAAARISSLLLENRWTLPIGAPVLPGQDVTAAIFDARGQRFATVTRADAGTNHSTVAWQLWETETGRALTPSVPAGDSVASIVFHPDGTSLLVTAGKEARLFDPATAHALGPALVTAEDLSGALFGPEGKTIITYTSGGRARVWDTATRQPLSPELVHDGAVTVVAISKDEGQLACGTENGKIHRWTLPKGEPIRKPLEHPGHLNTLQFDSLSGRSLLSGSSNGNLVLWLHEKDQIVTSFSNPGPDRMGGAALSPDGSTILAFGDDWTLRLWSLLQGKQIEEVQHGKEVMAAAFCPDAMSVVSGSRDGTVHLTGVGSGPMMPPLHLGAPISATCFSPDGSRLLTASRGAGVRIWNMASRRIEPQLLLSTSTVNTAHFSPSGQEIVTVGSKGRVQFWPIGSLVPARELPREEAETYEGATYSANGTVLITCGTRVRAWRADTLEPISVAPPLLDKTTRVVVSPDGRRVLAEGENHRVRLWQPAKPDESPAEVPGLKEVKYLSFASDSASFFLADDRRILFYHAADLALAGEVQIPDAGCQSVEYAPDGKAVLVGLLSGATQLLAAPTGELQRTFDPGSTPMLSEEWRDGKKILISRLQENSMVSLAHFDSAGRRIVVGRMNNAAYLWDVATGQQIVKPLAHKAGIALAAFSPNGEFLVTGTDAPTRFWHVTSGLQVAPLTENTDSPTEVEWRKDGSAYLTLGQDGELKVFHRFAADHPPAWLADLAEAYGGWHPGGEREESLLPVDRHEIWARLGSEVGALKEDQPWSRLGHWLLAGNAADFPATPNGGPTARTYFSPCRTSNELIEACWKQIGRVPFGSGDRQELLRKRHSELKMARLANALDFFPGDPRFLAQFAEASSELSIDNVGAQLGFSAISGLAARLGAQDAEVQWIHSAILARADMRKQARVYLDRALELDPQSVEVQLHAGFLLGTGDEKERAIQHFTRVLELVRRDHLSPDLEKGALRNRATLYVLLKQPGPAAADVAEMLRLDPEQKLPPLLESLAKPPPAAVRRKPPAH